MTAPTLPSLFHKITEARALVAKAKTAQRAAEVRLADARRRHDEAANRAGGCLHVAQYRAQQDEISTLDGELRQAVQARQAAEVAEGDAVRECREAADHFAIERVASIRGSTVGDKELRARILEAYGFASLSLAQELGRPGFVRPDEFVADLLAGIFSPEELSTAAAAAVERYMTGAAA